MDSRNLNKACPKDLYPLPRIDQIVDFISGWELLCIIGAYYGYHNIGVRREDKLNLLARKA
jgi:hypothetical protein